ncbi:hypothetical protein KBB96_12400 [Luteolibacter ambystomatis]|uniref:Uncharacterized protein n=1 Tax=Luteolibacter ambystomatis TaxID=2824561 RepID=A0A975G6F2_9BACT|nr:hypothetical protein [Luteolibacter ambystomatis]QUE49672.1 hypothetical protein KBB96_12400 [Luteolibacter ambystomatis]
MNAKRTCGWIVLIALAVVSGWWLFRSQPDVPSGSPVVSHPATVVADGEDETDFAARDESQRRSILGAWKELMRWMKAEPRPTPEEIEARLKELRIEWVAMDPTVLTAVLGEILRSGEDLPTGIKFAVGPHGLLDGWPTLRVFLLDVLAVSDPAATPAVAREVMDGTKSADEFAVALRSLTRKGPGRATDQELLSRFGGLLNHAGWGTEPGFAEAFDMVRYVGTSAAARQVLAWKGNPMLRTMALDEFASAHPAAMAEVIASPDTSGLAPAERAALMARADPSDARQLAAADTYLRNPDLTAEEAAAFLKIFPLRNATTGYRLYGENPAPYSKEGIAAGDRAALGQVDRWLADPELSSRYRAGLEPLQQRLGTWVKQASSR